MYPAFKPYQPKGNDYTFISRRVLTIEDRTDGFAGFFVASVLGVTKVGRTVLQVGRALAAEPARTLEHLIEPLIAEEDAHARNLKEQYESRFGELSSKHLKAIAALMEAETTALSRLCRNAASYSHYKRVRFYVIGLLAWLMNYLIKTSAGVQAPAPLMFFDFSGVKEGRTRIQSKVCYARLREIVGQFYRKFAKEGRFNPDPIAAQLFNKRNKHNQVLPDDFDFAFLETHFSDLALRMGSAQPRSSRVNERKTSGMQPDTLRVLMLSVLNEDSQDALPFDELCRRLADIWRVVVGGNADDLHRSARRAILASTKKICATTLAPSLVALRVSISPWSHPTAWCSAPPKSEAVVASFPAVPLTQAVGLRTASAVKRGSHLFCQELPPMDVERFLQVLGEMRLRSFNRCPLLLLAMDSRMGTCEHVSTASDFRSAMLPARSSCSCRLAKQTGRSFLHHSSCGRTDTQVSARSLTFDKPRLAN